MRNNTTNDSVYLSGISHNGATYGLSVSTDNLDLFKGTKKGLAVKDVFSYHVGYTPLYIQGYSYRALLVIEPRSHSVVLTVPFDSLSNSEMSLKNKGGFDSADDYVEEAIDIFESDDYLFTSALHKAAAIESKYLSAFNAFRAVIRKQYGITGKYFDNLCRTKDILDMSSNEMNDYLKTTLNEIITSSSDESVIDDIAASCSTVVPYLAKMGFIELPKSKVISKQKSEFLRGIQNAAIFEHASGVNVAVPLGIDDAKDGIGYIMLHRQDVSHSRINVSCSDVRLSRNLVYNVFYKSLSTGNLTVKEMNCDEILSDFSSFLQKCNQGKRVRAIPTVEDECQLEDMTHIDFC